LTSIAYQDEKQRQETAKGYPEEAMIHHELLALSTEDWKEN